MQNLILNSIELSTNICIPFKIINEKKVNSTIINGWNKYVKENRRKAILWHNLWKDNGRPLDGVIADLRRQTRNNYHKSINQAKLNQNKIIRENIGKKLENNDSKTFWKEIRKLNKSKKKISVKVDGKTTNDEISKNFKDHYEKLYNSYNDKDIDEVFRQTQLQTIEKCSNISNNDNHLHIITPIMVEKAISSLHKGKADTNDFLYTDSFINAPKILFKRLSELFTIMLRHCLSSNTFNAVIFSPIVKNQRKDITESSNYRAIAINSCLCKIFDYVVMDFFQSLFLSSSRQFAYKKNFSTTLCTYILMETIQYYTNRGSSVLVSLLDCSKAFDTVVFSKLFNILIRKGLCPLITRLLINLYCNIEASVVWNNHYSEKFKVNVGVKQGGVISPVLFSLYIDLLTDRIINSNVGCYVGDVCSSVLVYADDIVLIAPSRTGMQKLLNVCQDFGREYNLLYNPDKCEVIMFGTNRNSSITW